MGVGLVGGLISAVICLGQVDIKLLVAYSSVGHIGIVIRGLIRLNYIGYFGGLIIMVSHGLCSSGLFCMVNILYEKVGSRRIIIRKGLLAVYPSLSL